MEKRELLNKLLSTNLLSLAFIGDAVHTLFVREKMLVENGKMQNYHTKSSQFCKAEHQSKVFDEIAPTLTEDEAEVARRARNAKPKHQAKNASHTDYSKATMFEAVIGYLYLSENKTRLNEILEKSIL